MAGTQVEPGRMVFVTVSLGKEPKEGVMSDLTGYTKDSAVSYPWDDMTDEEFEALPFGSEGLWRKLMHAARS